MQLDPITVYSDNTNDPISVQPEQDPIPKLNDADAAERSKKAAFGLSHLVDQDTAAIYGQIADGQEKAFRDNASIAENAVNSQKRNAAIMDAVKQKGSGLSMQEFQKYMDPTLSFNQPSNPDTVIERAYGKAQMASVDDASNRIQDTILDDAKAEIPEELTKFFQQGSDLSSKREWWLSQSQNIQGLVDDQSYLGWGADQAKQLIPFYNEFENRGNTPETSRFSGFFLGENMDEQAKEFFRMPLDEMVGRGSKVLEVMKQNNPALARDFAHYMAGMSTDDKVLNDIMTPIEIANLYGLAKVGRNVLRKVDVYNRAQTAVKSALKDGDKPLTPANLAEAAGDTGEAAVQNTLEAHINNIKGIDDSTKLNLMTLTSSLRTQMADIKANAVNLSREELTRLLDAYDGYGKKMIDTVLDAAKIERVPWLTASEDGIRMLKETTTQYFKGRENTILDVDITKDPLSGSLFRVVKVGNYDGSLFNKESQAVVHASDNGYAGAKILSKEAEMPISREVLTAGDEGPVHDVSMEQKGLGYYLELRIPVSETENWVRDGLIWSDKAKSTSSLEGWRGAGNALLGWIRGASDTLSLQETTQRLKAVYTQNKFLELAKQEMKYVEDVVQGRITTDPLTGKPMTFAGGKVSYYTGKISGGNKTIYDQFIRALEAGRKLKDADGLPGKFFDNPMELHNFYQGAFSRPPTFEETQAYFAFVRAYDYDLAMRNIRTFANKSRLGTEAWNTVVMRDGQKIAGAQFDGVEHQSMPRTNDNILIQTKEGDKLANTETMNTKLHKTLDENIKSGKGKLVEVYDPERRPFDAVDSSGNKARVRYVYSETMERNPLSYDQIGRRGGGHFEYDYDHYVKQANIRVDKVGGKTSHWYEGDTTLMPVDNTVMGKDIAKRFETVRQLIKDGKKGEAKLFAEKNIDIPWKKLEGWFRPTRVNGVSQPARFNLSEPFQVVPNGRTIREIDKSIVDRYTNTKTGTTSFVDGTRHGSLARNFAVNYTQERDVWDMLAPKNIGSKYNPVYQYEPARFTDPLTTVTRALDRITNTLYMDDYKIYAVEHWLQENKDLLKNTQQELRGSPFFHFHEAGNPSSWQKATQETAPRFANAYSNYWKIRDLLGQSSTFDRSMQWVKQELNDLAYEKLGPKADKIMVAPDWLINHAPNPLSAARGLAFHDKLGLFNPNQLLTQSLNWVNVLALSPGHVAQGSFGALMHQWSRLKGDPAMIEAMGKWGESFGWKPGMLQEAMKTLDSTGFGVVGGEYALDQSMKHYYIRNGARTFLDLGQTFFKGAERNQRYAAWYTSFHEWRSANPLRKLDDAAVGEILTRADDMTVNMSRASNSALNKGILSIPAQFLSYQYRLGELFWSKRIGDTLLDRTMKRAILYGTYASLYGMPGALGLSGFPLGDYWRKSALEHGYVIGDNAAQTFVYEGGLSLLGALITGDGNFKVGNYYNFNDKVGANGFSPLREALRSNASLWKILGGAAGSVIGGTLTAGDGWFHAMSSMLSGKQDEEAFPMKWADWLDLANEVSSVSAARRMIYALNYGKWRSKNEDFITDVSAANAIFMSLSGLSPQEMDDRYTKTWTKQDEKAAFDDAEKKFIKNFRRAAEAADNGDRTNADDYYTRAFNELKFVGYPRERWSQVIAAASKGYESVIDRSDYTYYMKDTPEYRKPDARDAYTRKLEMNENK